MNSKKILLSFIGSNDSGNQNGKSDGAIFNTLKNSKFDFAHLIWIENNKKQEEKNKFLYIGKELEKKLIEQRFCENIVLDFLNIKNPVDHNEIYPKLLEYCENLYTSNRNKYTAAISSGTPAMQVCWILMAESGDFNLELIRTNEPVFGKEIISPVKLGTGLPRIVRSMKKQIKILKNLLPDLHIDVKSHKISIGDTQIRLSQMEFSYYRYFAERVRLGQEALYIPNHHLPIKMTKEILNHHRESFPNSDTRIDFENAVNKGELIPKARLLENITNIKGKIFDSLDEKGISENYVIQNVGTRKDGSYMIKIDPGKIKIVNKKSNT